MSYYFGGGALGWTSATATTTVNASSVTLTSTSTDPQFLSPTGLTLSGAAYTKLRVRLRRLAGSGWDGTASYSTPGHAISGSFFKTISAPIGSGWQTLVWDMSTLNAGGTDWTGSTITQLRFDFGSTAADVFEIAWIAASEPATQTLDWDDQSTYITSINASKIQARSITTDRIIVGQVTNTVRVLFNTKSVGWLSGQTSVSTGTVTLGTLTASGGNVHFLANFKIESHSNNNSAVTFRTALSLYRNGTLVDEAELLLPSVYCIPNTGVGRDQWMSIVLTDIASEVTGAQTYTYSLSVSCYSSTWTTVNGTTTSGVTSYLSSGYSNTSVYVVVDANVVEIKV